MSLTNFEKWKLYMRDVPSAENFIEWGFYYMISAALQRRVWVGPDHYKLYGNQFVILVAEPAVGKGVVIKPVSRILSYHKLDLEKLTKKMADGVTHQVDREMLEKLARQDYEAAEAAEGAVQEGKNKEFRTIEKPLVIPIAADATTYEALIKAIAKSVRHINYIEQVNGHDPRKGIYTHSSLCFCLEEISSLFRKRTEDLVHFLIQAYDCGDYTYDTKTQGKDRVRKCCLNFFGGTTPGFMQQTFDDQLITEGFSSRTFFIFATKNKKEDFWIPNLNTEQEQCWLDIVNHVGKLTELYGRVAIPDNVEQWVSNWWQENKDKRTNTSARLNPYYGRWKVHVQKLAMAIHFGETTTMELTIPDFEKAIQTLKKEERMMHYALGLNSDNPLANPARKILAHLANNGLQTRRELLAEFFPILHNGIEDLDAILEYLQSMEKIKLEKKEVPGVGTITYYGIPENGDLFI